MAALTFSIMICLLHYFFWLAKAWENIMRCMVSSSNNIISWLSYILQHPCISLLLIFSNQVSIGKQKKHNRIISLYKWKIEYLELQTIHKGIPILSITLCRSPLLEWKKYLNAKYYRLYICNWTSLTDVNSKYNSVPLVIWY